MTITSSLDRNPTDVTTAAPKRSGVDPVVLLPLIIGFALFMGTLDATIIANAIPTMARSLHQDPLSLNLAITSYLLASAVFLPVSGWIADRFGARHIFRGAIILFALSSAGCGLAHSLWHLVASRVLQGIASSMMLPVGRLVLLRALPRKDLVRAMGYLILPGVLGTVMGPPLGGFLVSFSDWRWIFFINIPMAAIGALLVTRYMPNFKEDSPDKLDVRGFLLAGSGLACFVYGLESVGRHSMPIGIVISLLVMGLLLGWAFALHTRLRTAPLLDLSIFNDRKFLAGTVGGLLLRLPLGATPFLMALLLQVGLGMSAFQAGLTSMADAIGALLTMRLTPTLVDCFGLKRLLVTNILLSGCVQLLYGLLTNHTSQWQIALLLFGAGMCRSTLFTGLNALAFEDLPTNSMSRASSLASVMTQIASSLGVGGSSVLLAYVLHRQGTNRIQAGSIAPIFMCFAIPIFVSLVFFVKLSGGRHRLSPTDETMISLQE